MTGLEKLVSMATHRSGKGRKQEQYDGARYVLYFRVSTRRQEASGLGLEAQKFAAAEFVRQHHGTVLAQHQEIESGRKCQRSELLKAILHARRSWAVLLIDHSMWPANRSRR